MVRWLNKGEEVSLSIDFIPHKDFKATEEMLIRKFAQSSAKSLKNILKELVPSRMANMLLQTAGICPDKNGNQITSKERKEIVMLLKKLNYSVLPNILFEKAQITCGGVTTKEINPKTMESKKIKGLYFAGEVIDIDGDSGGFNLQAAFSTGYLAGQ